MAKATRSTRNAPDAGEILDAALARAEAEGWEAVALRDVADELGIPLSELHAHYRDKDAIANALFARARDAMLAPVERAVMQMPAKERLRFFLLRWFDALGPHRRVAAEMLAAKAWPFHPHYWVPMVFDLSRLIQWLRDVAGLTAQGRRRQVEEVGLTVLFLGALAVWCRDDTDDQARTRAFLDTQLTRADGAMARLFDRAGSAPDEETEDAA